jgi:hypothetical protein
MNGISKILLFIIGGAIITLSCEEIQSYPETPEVDYKSFSLFRTTDALGNEILLGRLEFDFIDGDGNLGDSIPGNEFDEKYNLFLSLYDFVGDDFQKIEDIPSLKFRIPYIERKGQNKTLKGTITVDLEYKKIEYDTIFYTFYIKDRDENQSNTDTTEIIDLANIEREVEEEEEDTNGL